ncbi:MAG: ribosome biogenesis GTP-binding protein YihA/YsxC [Myxococcota bacterium]
MKPFLPRLLTSADNPKNFPPEIGREFVFAGASNVGKSSLINALLGKKIARTSNTPGKTRLINFFAVTADIFFVDLPGYGFAKVSKVEREKWKKLIETYFIGRKTIEATFALIDARRTPSEKDRALVKWLSHNNIRFFIVMTKADKLTKSGRGILKSHISNALDISSDTIIVTSAQTKLGIAELERVIFK